MVIRDAVEQITGLIHDDALADVTVDVGVDGDTAIARSYFTVLQVTAQGLHPILAGEYEDGFEKVDDAWRFTRRRFHPQLIGDLTHHMKSTRSP